MTQHHSESDYAPPKMVASNEEMERAQIPIYYRDYCAHHFIKWQDCLREKAWHWKCHEEEIPWQKCEYKEHQRIMKKRDRDIVARHEQPASE